jgi:hypothetical protein
MSIQETGQIIQFILAPVVMVSACGLLITGMMAQFGAINDRLRGLSRERLELLRGSTKDGEMDVFGGERLEEIDTQMPDLIERHGEVQVAILLGYGAILCLVLCMICIAIAQVTRAAFASTLILVFFLAGILTLLASITWMAREIRGSNRAVNFEARKVLSLTVPAVGERSTKRA